MDSKALALYTAALADDKKAYDIVVLQMEGISLMADYFVICHGNSEKQVQAIARGLKEGAGEKGITISRMEGFDQARWVLIDLGDVIAHVFHKDERGYYQLEKLWGDASQLEFEQDI